MASITKRGNAYRITVSNGQHPDGRQILETTTWRPDPEKTEKQNQKALQLFAMHFEERVKAGRYLDGEKLTLQQFSEIWIRDHVHRTLGAKTEESYQQALDKIIIPELGHLKLARIQPQHLNKLYGKMSADYAPGSIRRIHGILSSILSAAVRWNIIQDNPARRVQPPRLAQDKSIKCFDLEQTDRFLKLLETMPTQLKLFLHLAIFTGCRRGELIALEWSDLDLESRQLRITKSTVVVHGALVTKEPKTAASERQISLPGHVIEMARQWRKEQLQYRLSIGDKWEGENYIFTTWNGHQMRPETPYKAFKRIIKGYNKTAADPLPEIPLHGLRHTSATLLISENVDVRTVSNRLGHSRTSTTLNIYSHALEKSDQAAADTLEKLFSNGS